MSDWYLGTKACGCSVACIAIKGRTADDKEWRREVARFVADCVKRGMTLEKVTDADSARGGPVSAGGGTPDERVYPCDGCGVMRSKDEGGTVFTVCDGCWDKSIQAAAVPPAAAQPPADPDMQWDSLRRGGLHSPAAQPPAEILEEAAKVAEYEHSMGTNGVGIAAAIRHLATHPKWRAPAAQPGERAEALAEAQAACEAIRDECHKSWQSFAEDEQRKHGKEATKAGHRANESYYAYETANDCAKAIQRLRSLPGVGAAREEKP